MPLWDKVAGVDSSSHQKVRRLVDRVKVYKCKRVGVRLF
jgi:hypothetical protein